MTEWLNNPFTVKTPETMTAQEVVDLYVPISEYFDIQGSGHVFVHGHRGCGKSMMFRLLAPDCQAIKRGTDVASLPYYGVYLSVKATDLNIPEFRRLEGQIAGYILSEHSLVGYLAGKTMQSLLENVSVGVDAGGCLSELLSYCERSVFDRLQQVGWSSSRPDVAGSKTAGEALAVIIRVLDSIYSDSMTYLKRLSFISDLLPYTGPLLGFRDFLFPLLKDLRSLSFMPKGPIYLLIDDADNLNFQQTQVLNTWVSYRTTADLCLKISTQMNYKTRLTTSSQRIESPHDYTEISLADVYTGSAKEKYPEWVADIVVKRLNLSGVETTAREFFPEDEEQEAEIAKLYDSLKGSWTSESGGGADRAGDYAYRNARPDYIKALGGPSKHSHDYKYAGFQQLVHISSGIIRYFLDPASRMYSEQKKLSADGAVRFIPPTTQDKVIRDAADQIMLGDFDQIIDDLDKCREGDPEIAQKMRRLRNLIYSMGALFRQILESDRTERRVFSFAISDEPDPDVKEILRLGVQFGYLYESSIGTKEGMGRTRLYVLTRRLAPFFKLDPTGFSGYKFVTNSFLRMALDRPKTIQNRLRSLGANGVIGSDQLSFDFVEAENEN